MKSAAWIAGVLVAVAITGGAFWLARAAGWLPWGESPAVTPAPTSGLAVPAEDAGYIISDVVVGTGNTVTDDPVQLGVAYTGSYGDGTLFDTSHSDIPLNYVMGDPHPPIWDKGLEGMKIGGTRLITILPSWEGRALYAAQYPPDKTLVFSIKLYNMVDRDIGEPLHPPPGIPQVQPGF